MCQYDGDDISSIRIYIIALVMYEFCILFFLSAGFWSIILY